MLAPVVDPSCADRQKSLTAKVLPQVVPSGLPSEKPLRVAIEYIHCVFFAKSLLAVR